MSSQAPTYALSTWFFLRALGVIYLAAFVSLAVQIRGLIGRTGIAPVGALLEDAKHFYGDRRLLRLPTLAWFNSTDTFLIVLSWGGAVLAVALVAGIAPVVTLTLLWAFYLSLFNVCRLFLGYQWDALLLEMGFLAIWLAPHTWLLRWPPIEQPPRVALWLTWWLLFRLMFSSGVVKVRSGDRTWRTLTALTFHYETQPLPTPLGWFAHQAPVWVHKASCAVMFGIELAAPFLVFAPQPLCALAAVLTIALMLGVMATGNYCFFNLQTIALSMLVFDDAAIRRVFPANRAAVTSASPLVLAVGALLAVLSVRPVAHLFARHLRWPRSMESLFASCEPWHLVNSYGLFAVMTTVRREIIVEGSDDGADWKRYDFKWKPSDPMRRPRYCMPHQPRLDWQMWFAALADYRAYPWFMAFLARLLENSPPVVRLLRTNPFPTSPPRYLRALTYRYRFTDPATRRQTGAWWQRELLGLYCPVLVRTD